MTFFHYSLDTDYLDIVNKPNSLRPNLDWKLNEIKIGSIVGSEEENNSYIALRYQKSRYYKVTYIENNNDSDIEFSLTECSHNPLNTYEHNPLDEFEWLSVEDFWVRRCFFMIKRELSEVSDEDFHKLLTELSQHLDYTEWNERRLLLQIIDFAMKLVDLGRYKHAYSIFDSMIREIRNTDEDYFYRTYPELKEARIFSLREYFLSEAFEKIMKLTTSDLFLRVINQSDDSDSLTRSANIQRVIAFLKNRCLTDAERRIDVLPWWISNHKTIDRW